MRTQRGKAVRFFAGAPITNALDAHGIGKAVTYGTGVAEVIEGVEANAAKFAGVIKTVDFEASVVRSNALVNFGARSVVAGDAVGLITQEFAEVIVTETIAFGDLLTLDSSGHFKKLTLSATPTAEEVLKICARAMSSSGTVTTTGTVVAKIMGK